MSDQPGSGALPVAGGAVYRSFDDDLWFAAPGVEPRRVATSVSGYADRSKDIVAARVRFDATTGDPIDLPLAITSPSGDNDLQAGRIRSRDQPDGTVAVQGDGPQPEAERTSWIRGTSDS